MQNIDGTAAKQTQPGMNTDRDGTNHPLGGTLRGTRKSETLAPNQNDSSPGRPRRLDPRLEFYDLILSLRESAAPLAR